MLVNGRDVPPVAIGCIIGAVACFLLGGIQARRAPHKKAKPETPRDMRTVRKIFAVAFVVLTPMAGYGAYLLYQRNTGPHIAVTVTRCSVAGTAVSHSGPHDYCYGDWTYEGRTYTGKYVQGASIEDEGKVIDCTLHGDTAYSRDLQTPLIALIVFGSVSLLSIYMVASRSRRLAHAK